MRIASYTSVFAFGFAVCASALLGTVIAQIASSASQPQSPSVTLERGGCKTALVLPGSNSVELGCVCEGTDFSLQAVLHNPTAQEIVLDGMRTSCGCTSVETTSAFRIAAGWEHIVPIRVKTDGKRGEFREHVEAYNTQGTSVYVIDIHGNVKPLLEVSSQMLPMTRNEQSPFLTSSFTVVCGPEPLPRFYAQTPVPWDKLITVTSPGELRPSERVRVNISMKAIPVFQPTQIPVHFFSGNRALTEVILTFPDVPAVIFDKPELVCETDQSSLRLHQAVIQTHLPADSLKLRLPFTDVRGNLASNGDSGTTALLEIGIESNSSALPDVFAVLFETPAGVRYALPLRVYRGLSL